MAVKESLSWVSPDKEKQDWAENGLKHVATVSSTRHIAGTTLTPAALGTNDFEAKVELNGLEPVSDRTSCAGAGTLRGLSRLLGLLGGVEKVDTLLK